LAGMPLTPALHRQVLTGVLRLRWEWERDTLGSNTVLKSKALMFKEVRGAGCWA